MLLYPSQDKLLDKIDSKYSLVILAAKRAKEMQDGKNVELLDEYVSTKNVGKALEEIESGDIVLDPDSVRK
ncbi:DNA-directed RNA polymerase subunit omega [Marinilactibacillus psychrotolerans]|uniref:DNA-directed RNA polymerase subunit omega n=2 Tax=Marinilactibacillus psychrotolerans TaxID=191770 RepID=A0A511GY54_9LACT|nr:DNA-directed RNA polymerase subunit omega [Marinilactibacillus psychrotolerans]TLQ08528.1 DNA-directed RNA polymerase subunit omega [Marinilactibacillus psychrotolerans]SDB95274.1 DNA-directed RNA polymerase subunit omega [Marinilactibacillus psychrotolerans]SJN35022.1 DNA-directed RNA polymerase omega subunit [Marinilactibacillus psychrotolerans 42ea]GEL66187.1 DNA-directed RNA polymerase subunit omega [Marinilactibacillus psychrotolerans]GEQ32939.1 DNA-directed RNA polymerase subunit omeg